LQLIQIGEKILELIKQEARNVWNHPTQRKRLSPWSPW